VFIEKPVLSIMYGKTVIGETAGLLQCKGTVSLYTLVIMLKG